LHSAYLNQQQSFEQLVFTVDFPAYDSPPPGVKLPKAWERPDNFDEVYKYFEMQVDLFSLHHYSLFCLVWYLRLHCFTHIVPSELLKSKPDAKNLPLDFTRRIVWNPKIACTICNAKKQKTLIGKNLYISHYMHHIFFMLLIRYLCCYRVNERLGSTI
jgi:hypothetical protein